MCGVDPRVADMVRMTSQVIRITPVGSGQKGADMAAGYAELLRTRHAARLLVGTLIGRLPNGTAPIAIVLFTRAEGGSYSLAGALAAAYGVANAVGQPLLGRAVDLYGQPRVQLPAALVSALGMVWLALSGTGSVAVAYAAVVIAGLFTPPLEGGLRALWPSVLGGREERVHQAYAMDAVAQEVMFTVGPLLVTLFVAVWSPAGALLALNAIGVLGALSVGVSEPLRGVAVGPPAKAHWLGGGCVSRGLLGACWGAFFLRGDGRWVRSRWRGWRTPMTTGVRRCTGG
ncbi:transmembrane transport protein [Streptomyces sp. Mg1]|nr:transmembrane transport protein [Streptomyces sp. Mg1]